MDAPLSASDAGERIRACIREAFARLTEDGSADADWAPAVRRFLLAFQAPDS